MGERQFVHLAWRGPVEWSDWLSHELHRSNSLVRTVQQFEILFSNGRHFALQSGRRHLQILAASRSGVWQRLPLGPDRRPFHTDRREHTRRGMPEQHLLLTLLPVCTGMRLVHLDAATHE